MLIPALYEKAQAPESEEDKVQCVCCDKLGSDPISAPWSLLELRGPDQGDSLAIGGLL